MILIVLAIGLLGYVLAGVIGKVFAETIIDVTWPASGFIRAVATPLTFGLRQVERVVEWLAGPEEALHRPASVEVEIAVSDEEDAPEDEEPDLPEDVREMLERTIELTRTDVVGDHDAPSDDGRPGLDRVRRRGGGDLPADRAEPHPGLRRQPRRHHRHPVPQRPVRRHDRGRTSSRSARASSSGPAFFVPETKNAFELLEEMRRDRRQIAIVLDEYGGMAGVVDARGPARRAGRHDRRRARRPRRRTTRSGRWAIRATRSTPPCPSIP